MQLTVPQWQYRRLCNNCQTGECSDTMLAQLLSLGALEAVKNLT